MADTDQVLADCVGAVYEAATGDGSWLDVGRRMLMLLDARSAMLFLPDGPMGEWRNVLAPPDSSQAAYQAYFHAVDPYVARAKRDFATARGAHLGRAKVGAELVPDDAFVESEYYVDFARHHQRRHMIGGIAGVDQASPIGLFRGDDSIAFGQQDVRFLEMLLPHFQRALELRARLMRDRKDVSLTRSALDASPVGVVLVDNELRVHFTNELAGRLTSAPGSGLALRRHGPQGGAPLRLVVRSSSEADALQRLVGSATSGGAGGALKVAGDGSAPNAILVSPLPPGLAADVAGDRERHGMAMITIRPLRASAVPPPELLCDMFAFTRAEAEVAIALAGGGTAEDVARKRGVSLVTVRTQIRSILGKSESENLRDFECALASLGTLFRDGRTQVDGSVATRDQPGSTGQRRVP